MVSPEMGPASPGRQFKVPIPSIRRTQPRRKRGRRQRRNEHDQPDDEVTATDTRLILSPQHKAVTPYTPGSVKEELYLRFLIHFFVTVVTAEKVTNVGPRFEWYPLAVHDDAFFHALISSVSSHVAYNKREEDPRDFYYHKGIAIRMINDRLARGFHDEGTINTVVIFALQEGYMGRTPLALIHLNGVLQLVADAGGIHSPTLSAKTRRHVYLTDLTACVCLQTKPRLPPNLQPNLRAYFGRKSRVTAVYTKTFRNRLYNFTSSPLSDVAADVLWGLRNVSATLEAVHDGTESPDTILPEDIQFSDRVEALQRRASELWYVEDPKYPQHVIFRTFGWACMIYIYTTLRELPPELPLNSLIAGRIKVALEECSDLNVLLATFQDLLLWQMFICGRIADPRDRPFFVSQASKILLIRKLENADDILISSEGFLWPEREIGIRARTKKEPRQLTPVQEELEAL